MLQDAQAQHLVKQPRPQRDAKNVRLEQTKIIGGAVVEPIGIHRR